MNILYIGDIMGEPGIEAVRRALPDIRKEYKPDLVIAQAENTTGGKGISKADFKRLRDLGIDFCSGGDWSVYLPEIYDYLNDPQQPIIRPANYPEGTPGSGYKYINTATGSVLAVSLRGSIVGKKADQPIDNPLKVIDQILEKNKLVERSATIVNFHGDFSSEKRMIGYYLDGRVTAVIGDHWHVPTADSIILPKGTAHITDVGMCGTLHSSLGVKLSVTTRRWYDGRSSRNELETNGPFQFNAVLVKSDDTNQSARSIQHIQRILD